MYESENNDTLMPANTWVAGIMTWTATADNIDMAKLVDASQSIMATYVKSAKVYKCPGDVYDAPNGERVRSVSMNGALGWHTPTVKGTNPNGRIYYGSGSPAPQSAGALKMGDLTITGPARVYVILDEQADSINDGIFAFDPGYPGSGEYWRDLPASYHNRAGSFSFADGHSEIHKWTEKGTGVAQTVYPVTKTTALPWKVPSMRNSADYEWMQDGMPYK
jgi:prepilin-type processing-associated H-X9-DG protein